MPALKLVLYAAILSVGSASAVSLCTDPGNSIFAGLIAHRGCEIQNKVFTFTVDSYIGGGYITPGDVMATAVSHDLGDDESFHGWVFEPTSNWTTGFNIVYLIGVLPTAPLVQIAPDKVQQNAGPDPAGPPTVVAVTQNSGILALPALNANSNGSGGVTALTSLAPTEGIGAMNALSTPDGEIPNGSENDLHRLALAARVQANGDSAPEPRPELMFAGGLLGLAMLLRLKRGTR